MWRDRLDVFWDGKRTLALGFFDAEAAAGLRPDLVVASGQEASAPDDELVDLIDQERWRDGCQILVLPQDHVFLTLRAADGVELRLALAAEKAGAGPGEWRMLLTELPEEAPAAAPAFRAAPLIVRGDVERAVEEQVVRSGPKLLWALTQKRCVERRGDLCTVLRLWPAQRVFPLQQSRLVIEAAEIEIAQHAAALRAPVAIMEQWLSEDGAPCAQLRLRFPSFEFSEGFLSRVSVFLVMQQRRRLRDWARQQRETGGAIADPLTCDDIRRATGRFGERLEAAETPKTLVVHNLLKLCTGGGGLFDGVAVRRETLPGELGGVVVDAAFYAAALGDDLGLVSTSFEAGDFEVAPKDPGGARFVRCFRFDSDGLTPRPIADDDPLLDEILRLAVEGERMPAAMVAKNAPDKGAGLQARRDKFFAGLNAALAALGYAGRFDPLKLWETLEPFEIANYLALVEAAPATGRVFLQKQGAYDAFRTDPALTQALARDGDVLHAHESGGGARASRRPDGKSLAHRYAAACGLGGAVPADADLDAQLQAFAILRRGEIAKHLFTARIALDGAEVRLGQAAHAAEVLANEAMAERAAIYCDDWDFAEKATALRAYLDRRRLGDWTPLSEAESLAAVVEEADAYWREVGENRARARAEAEIVEEKPAGIFAAVRRLFLGGGQKGARP